MTPFAVISKAVGGLIGLAIDLIHSGQLTLEEKQRLLLQVRQDVDAGHARAQAAEIRDV